MLTRLLRRDARHVAHLLTAYVHHELEPRRAERVRRHLAQCPTCAEMYAAVRAVAASAEAPARRPAPPDLWPAIAGRLGGTPPVTGRTPWWAMRRPAAVAAAALALAAVGFWWSSRTLWERKPEAPRIYPASGPQTPLELAARDLHRDWSAGDLRFDIETDQPPALTDWLRRTAGLDVPLSDLPPGDRPAVSGRVRLQGAKRVAVGGRPGIMVGYFLDGAPVTLVVTPAAEASATAQMMNGFVYRADAEARISCLTWTRDGQTYALVARLSTGAQSCLICHQRDERRRQIAGLADLKPSATTLEEPWR